MEKKVILEKMRSTLWGISMILFMVWIGSLAIDMDVERRQGEREALAKKQAQDSLKFEKIKR